MRAFNYLVQKIYISEVDSIFITTYFNYDIVGDTYTLEKRQTIVKKQGSYSNIPAVLDSSTLINLGLALELHEAGVRSALQSRLNNKKDKISKYRDESGTSKLYQFIDSYKLYEQPWVASTNIAISQGELPILMIYHISEESTDTLLKRLTPHLDSNSFIVKLLPNS